MFKKIILMVILYYLQSITVFAAFHPIQESSLIKNCSYTVDWFTVNWATYSTSNISTDCSITWLNLPDGIFDITFTASDNSTPANVRIFDPLFFKIDTTVPTCILDSIELHWINNQYYNNWNFYYKSSTNASWKFVLNISCTDTEPLNLWVECNWDSCVSWLDIFSAPTILGKTPIPSYSLNTDEKKVFSLSYEWSWYQTDSFDILNNGTFISDLAWNQTWLDTNNTSLIFKNNNWDTIDTIDNITKLQLVPDSEAPTITWVFQYAKWNNWELWWADIISNNFNYTFFSALNNREIYTPVVKDLWSWLRWYNVNLENYMNSDFLNVHDSIFIDWSTLHNRSTWIFKKILKHNFSDVSEYWDYNENSWYRTYSWDIRSLSADWNETVDMFCDMVWNCSSVSTPDLKVVANIPDLNVTKSASSFNALYTNVISNNYDEYNLKIAFKDKYNNEIVPVVWVKNIDITNKFTNTLWLNQLDINTANDGDWVDFEFTDWNNWIISKLNITDEYHNLIWNLSSKWDLDKWELNIGIKSAVPTYNEYITALDNPWDKNKSMYWEILTAELKFNEFKIDVNNSAYEWVWEFTTTWNSFLWILPEFKFDPLITFDYIWNIFPLVEWQYKSMDLRNIVTDNSELDYYDLDIKTSTNNNFLQFTKSHLTDNNKRDWIWNSEYNEYHVLSNNSSLLWSVWYWTMTNSTAWFFQVLPQTIGWITDENTMVALYSELSYITNWKEVNLPWIQTWFKSFWIHEIDDFKYDNNYNTDSSIIFSQIKIWWITQSNNILWTTDWEWAITTDNSTYNDFSKITLLDLKTNINRNISLLLKWENLSDATVWSNGSEIDIYDFSNFNTNQWLVLQNSNVLYIKDRDVNIKCSNNICWILGKKTIIIENGNLTINSDMYYADNNSVLWIILIWNESNWNTSQLKINENVTNWVWIVYSEGPVVSVNSFWEVYDWYTVGENLVNQLYWKWSFMTRNTVWWSILDLNIRTSCPYGTPDYEQASCTQEKAQAYDLIYLRRYARVDELKYYWTKNNPMWDNKVPLHYDSRDVKIAWGITIYSDSTMDSWNNNLIKASSEYNAPLILNYDSNIQSNPPYWFEK